MGERDTAEKVLEDYNDVFADIVNVLLFEGKELMKEEELSNAKSLLQKFPFFLQSPQLSDLRLHMLLSCLQLFPRLFLSLLLCVDWITRL